jgi:4,5-DOPA dioxygenase extradiol
MRRAPKIKARRREGKSKLLSRRNVLAGTLGAAGLAIGGWSFFGPVESMLHEASQFPETDRMPALFIGHGTPMSAINPNEWTQAWAELGPKLPRPRAILSISAHWLTQGGALVTMSEKPPMNYDMHGFPPPMYQITYPAPGDVRLAKDVASALSDQIPVQGDTQWGFDHATWVVLKYLFPKADIPVIQLSIDYSKPPAFHYELGKHLQALRTRGVLILGSGNVVHNLSKRPGTNNNQPYDWAVEFDQTMNSHINDGNHQGVVDFLKLGSVAALAHPTYDHFLPLLYCLGVKTKEDNTSTFSGDFPWPAVSMRSFVIA